MVGWRRFGVGTISTSGQSEGTEAVNTLHISQNVKTLMSTSQPASAAIRKYSKSDLQRDNFQPKSRPNYLFHPSARHKIGISTVSARSQTEWRLLPTWSCPWVRVVRLPPDGFWRDFVTATHSDLISNTTQITDAQHVSIVEVDHIIIIIIILIYCNWVVTRWQWLFYM